MSKADSIKALLRNLAIRNGKPNTMTYPSLLNTDAIVIRTYSLESIISEKFHAMVDLSFANSRMKEFYDIVMLSCHNNFKYFTTKHQLAISKQSPLCYTEVNSMQDSGGYAYEDFLGAV